MSRVNEQRDAASVSPALAMVAGARYVVAYGVAWRLALTVGRIS